MAETEKRGVNDGVRENLIGEGTLGERRQKRVEFRRATCLHRRRSRKNDPRVLAFFPFFYILSPSRSFDGDARRGLKKI